MKKKCYTMMMVVVEDEKVIVFHPFFHFLYIFFSPHRHRRFHLFTFFSSSLSRATEGVRERRAEMCVQEARPCGVEDGWMKKNFTETRCVMVDCEDQ